MAEPHGVPPLSTKLYYGIGAIAFGVKNNGFSYFILFYYNAVLGLSASLTGLALFLALVFDAISDPIVGHMSDQWRSKWGRRHPFMYASIIPIGISSYYIWAPPSGLEGMGLFWYLFGMAVLVRTCVTFFEIPNTSLVAELTDDYDERTTMLSYRYFFGWWGGLTVAVVAYLVFLAPTADYPAGITNPAGYPAYGLLAAVFMVVSILISSLGTHRDIPNLRQPPPPRPFSFRQTAGELLTTLANRPFLVLFFAAIIAALPAGVASSLNIYFNSYYWGLNSSQIVLFPLGGFFAAIIALIIAPRIAKRHDKKTLVIALSLFSVFFLPLPIILRLFGFFFANDHALFLPVLVAHNLIEVAVLILIGILLSSMVADIVEHSELRTGRRSEGLFFAARGFAAKVVHGLGIMVGGFILAIVALPTGAAPADVDPAILGHLAMVYVPTIMVSYLAAIFVLSFYRISREDHAENLRKLKERNSA